jgi:predicted O-methyltransferase YrrM
MTLPMPSKSITNAQFLESAFSDNGPKIISGFSRPVYHNLMGLLHGRKYNKKDYGGMIRHTEAGMLYKWASDLPKGSVVVEIGCYDGLSTSYLAAGIARKSGSMVYAMDPFNSDLEKQGSLTDDCVALNNKPTLARVNQRMAANGYAGCVTLIEGYSQEVASDWNKEIDFLWIDGNHEQAFQDFVDFRPWLKNGARVAVHDAHPRYGYKAVVRDVRRIFANDNEWRDMEHVKSIISGIYIRPVDT